MHIYIYTSTEIASSSNDTNFIVENADLGSIKLLNIQTYLIYDGTRIKWQQDLRLLKNFVENVVGLSGKWKSPAWWRSKAVYRLES